MFNTPIRWGLPVENDWVDIDEPWSTHWSSVLFDLGPRQSFDMGAHEVLIDRSPYQWPSNVVAFPHNDFPGYWTCPCLGRSYYFTVEVRVFGSEERHKCWVRLSDEEEGRLWERHLFNDMMYNPNRYEE